MSSSGEVQPQAQFEMPIPQAENQPDNGELQHDRALEKSAADDSRVGKQQPSLPAAPVVADDSQVTATVPDDQASDIPDSGLAAKESDKIEKQWVDKAKSIIAQTKDDPFVQKNEMSKFKAEYIQKRYNKTIPVDGAAKT